MGYINTTRRSRLRINNVDFSSRLISWQASDESAFKNGIIKTIGTLVLGATALSQFDYMKQRFKRGQEIVLDILKPGTASTYERHPRGLLYVMGESFDPSAQEITIQMGCRLRLMELTENIDEIDHLAPIPLDASRQDFGNISNSFAAAGQYLYQRNDGQLATGSCFGANEFGNVNSVESTWLTHSLTSAVSVSPIIGAAPIPDQIKLSYSFSTTEAVTNPEVITETNTSSYGLKYPGVIFTRVGSGKIPTDTTGDGGGSNNTSICGNSPQNPTGAQPGSGNPGACSGIFNTVEEPTKKTANRTEITTSTYGGPGKQISNVTKETFGPALELNPQYYADRYAYCRFNFATACNPNGTCETEGMEQVLQMRTIESYTYSDSDGSLIERNLEEYRPTLAAAQPFDWRSGVVGGVPTSFTELSVASLFRSKITNQRYSVNEDGANVETTTLSESSAVKSRAGINATSQENTAGGQLILSVPTSYPNLQGQLSALPVTTVTGEGIGMTINADFPTGSGEVLESAVDNFSFNNEVPSNQYFAGGSGEGFRASVKFSYFNTGSGGWDTRKPNVTIEDPGVGYTDGDLLTWTSIKFGETNTFVLRVTKVRDNRPSLEIQNLGQGYQIGDQLKVSLSALSAANGSNPVSRAIVFSVVGAPDRGINGGNSIVSLSTISRPGSFIRGHYTNISAVAVTGNGAGASVNIESINTGLIEQITAYQAPRLNFASQNPDYEPSIGEFEPTGGSGTGLKVELGIGEFESPGVLVPSRISIRRIVDQGTGYKEGDILTVTWQELEDAMEYDLLHEVGSSGQYPKDLKIVINSVNVGEVFIFPSSPGANFNVGDELEVTSAVLESIGAQVPGTNLPIRLRVRQVSADIELGSLRLDAAEGVQTVTINTSQTKSTLPEAPDSVATPQVKTETVETTVQVRADQYREENLAAGPLTAKESVPVPLIGSRDEVQAQLSTYSETLRSFLLGEVLGLQVGESMRDEIMTSWKPMIGFRYVDAVNNQTMAMRADSATWAVNANEAVCVFNGLWIGNVVDSTGGPQPTFLDQGDYTQQLDFYYRFSLGISPASNKSGVITPIVETKPSNYRATLVIAVEGLIVENGGTISLGGDGDIPADLRGQILVDDVVIVDSDIFSDD